MDKKKVLETIKKARESAKKRNFSQSVDLIVNLQQLDLKKPEQKVDLFINLPKGRGKKIKVCGLFGPESQKEGEANCDIVISQDNFHALSKDKRKVKKLIKEYDFFLGQANIMPLIAKNFGRSLGTKGKMPNPKAGMIVPPGAPLKPVMEKMQNMIRLTTKSELVVKGQIGTESMSDDDLAENIKHVYDKLSNSLPQHEHNIKNSFLKLTMGKPALLGGKA